ncbi:retrovirus-related pol polyprotein from transposon TNT 1-94 [Tanacetum coccineum]
MDSKKYLEGQSMQRPQLFESDSFIYWKNRFETYLKSKDLDLWHVITNSDFQPIEQNPETKLDEVISFEKQSEDLKKRLAKNNEAKMVIYNALPRKEYERIFICNTAKEIQKTLLIIHQALDEGCSSKNYVRKFLRALHPKWKAKVTTIEESKYLTSLSLDELIGNLKVHEMIIKKDFKIVKAKGERISLALKTKKESSDEECLTSGSEDKEYAMAFRDFKKFFKRRGRFGDSSEEDDQKANDETCLVAQASSEVCSESSYFSDENSSIDDLISDREYDKLCKMSLKIVTKNKRLKAIRNSLENEIRELKEKLSKLEKNKGVDFECTKCQILKIDNKKLKEEALKVTQFEKSTHSLNELLSNQKPFGDKSGLGLNLFEASSSGTKEIKFIKPEICLGVDLEPDEWIKDSGCSKHMTGNRKLFSTYKAYNGVNVIFGSNLRGNIIGKGQICDNKCRVTFSEQDSEITKDGKVIGRASKELVRNLPKLKFDQHFCDACKIGKQAHVSHKAKNIVSTTRCLELLHMDLFGPSAIRCYGGNLYTLVIVDDYSRYTWTRFLRTKNEAFDQFKIISRKIQNQLGCPIVSIRRDHNREFDNEVKFGEFRNANGITHYFSTPRTPQSNGMVERKNRTLLEMSRTMLNEQPLPQKFWCYAVDTSTYILNQILIRAILGKTPYELLRGRKPTLDYFRVFGSKCFILNTKDYLTNFDPKSYKESLNVTFDKTSPPSKTLPLVDDELDEEETIKVIEKKNLENDTEDETLEIDDVVNIKKSRNHPLENVIGNLNQRTLRSQDQNQSNFFCFISTIKPKNVNEALKDESWIFAMQEELNQLIANDVWELVPQPKNITIIGTKWVYRNKLDENGIVSRNKARLVAQGYNQQKGIDYDETYALVARLESIRILLAYAYALYFKLFQINVKSAFLNGFINEEVYMAQPPGFIDFEKLDHIYKLKKALYGLKQAPKAWYDRLKAFLTKHESKNKNGR